MSIELAEYHYDAENIDLDDPRDVMGFGMDAINEIKSLPRKRLIKMFDLGCVFAQGKTTLPQREQAKLLNLNHKIFTMMMTTARKFDYNKDKFIAYCDEKGITGWVQYLNHIMPKKDVDVLKLSANLENRIGKLFNTLQTNGHDDKNKYYEALARIRDKITRYVPLDNQLINNKYVQYYECCCCGEYPPPKEGFRVLRYNQSHYLSYPICQNCYDDKKQPNLERIALMYASYAINLEQAYDKI